MREEGETFPTSCAQPPNLGIQTSPLLNQERCLNCTRKSSSCLPARSPWYRAVCLCRHEISMRLLASSSCGGMQLLLLCMGLPLVSALPPIVDPGSSQPSNPSTLQQPDLPPSNASSLQASGLEFACLGGPNYGEDMAPQNCMNAAERLLSNIDVPYQRVLTFRDRRVSDRSQPADVWLPQVSVSCKDLIS